MNIQDKIPLGLTFDDVLLVPQYSEIESRSQIDISSKFSRNVPLKIPIVSSPMDTVTEYEMAVEMARNGGLGIIHRFMSIEEQANQVARVKSTESHIIENPITLPQNTTLAEVKKVQEKHNIKTILISQDEESKNQSIESPSRRKSEAFLGRVLVGMATNRDLRLSNNLQDAVGSVMIPFEQLTVITCENLSKMPSPSEIQKIMTKKRIEKIPIVNARREILGLATLRDIQRLSERPFANLDKRGQLFVGAAVGANQLDRASALVQAGADVLVVDMANGHSILCINTVKELKAKFPQVDIVAGSIATGEGAEKLIQAGADGLRCGIGNGSICITRIIAGAGVPQLSAIFSVAPVCKKYGIPLISDGGNRYSGNMCKALAAGADCIMLGRLVGGCEESPSKVLYKDGKLVKVFRGMAGLGASIAKNERTGEAETNIKKFTPEGVEGYIPYAGPLKDVLVQFQQGIRSGFSYIGGWNIEDSQKKVKFIRMTASGGRESGVHDISKI